MAIEIQVRTRWQHEWADMFEKLADAVGRDIRYGSPAAHWLAGTKRAELPGPVIELYDNLYAARESVIRHALALANYLGSVEKLEAVAPGAPSLEEDRREISTDLSGLRKDIVQLSVHSDVWSRLLSEL